MELKTKIRKMGNSFGIIIPSEIVRAEGFREGENVSLTIGENGWTVGEIMREAVRQRLGGKFKKPTKELLNELDLELEPETFDE